MSIKRGPYFLVHPRRHHPGGTGETEGPAEGVEEPGVEHASPTRVLGDDGRRGCYVHLTSRVLPVGQGLPGDGRRHEPSRVGDGETGERHQPITEGMGDAGDNVIREERAEREVGGRHGRE